MPPRPRGLTTQEIGNVLSQHAADAMRQLRTLNRQRDRLVLWAAQRRVDHNQDGDLPQERLPSMPAWGDRPEVQIILDQRDQVIAFDRLIADAEQSARSFTEGGELEAEQAAILASLLRNAQSLRDQRSECIQRILDALKLLSAEIVQRQRLIASLATDAARIAAQGTEGERGDRRASAHRKVLREAIASREREAAATRAAMQPLGSVPAISRITQADLEEALKRDAGTP